jgi:tol-pal system protein YbgF
VFKKAVGGCLLLILPLWAGGAGDKTKKAYELIYEDVQVLKTQIQDILAKVEKNVEDIRLLRDELNELGVIIRRSQADQAGLKEDMKAVPQQYEALAGKIEQLSLDLARIFDAVAPAKAGAPAATQAAAEPKPEEKETAAAKPPEKKPETGAPPVPAPSGASAQDVYNMAYNDYLKGNFDLAVEGFKMYKDQFPASPLADNALYWIGECDYSQRKFDEAVNVFNELIMTYPQGDKVPAAFLKKGMSFAESGKKEEALAAYKLLITKFPLEEETRIAQQKIKELAEK